MVAKKNYKNKSVSQKQSLDIIKITTYFITVIICAGLIFNGYFFENQSLTVSILTTAFFLVALIIFHKKQIPFYYDKKTALLGLAFLLINIIGLFTASNTREALGNVLIITNAILLYFLASQSLRERDNLNIFLKGFYWTTTFIASLGILSFIFGINILNSYMNNRLFSTLEYPNTAALVFIFAIFIGYYFRNNESKIPNIFLISNSILFLAFIGTKSRGVFLIAPLLLIIYIFLQQKENRLKIAGDFALLILPCIIIAPVVYNGTFANREFISILISLVALLILFALYYFSPRFLVKKNFKIITILALLLLVGAGGFLVTQQDLLGTNNIFSRFTNISSEDSSVQARFVFMQDALKIVKDNLLFGTGGGGWNAEYRAYRSYLYFTSEVHNHYLQVLVENGILGFVAYLGLWFFLIFNLWRKYSSEKSDSNLLILTISIGLMLHSFIDFDLTYPAIYFLFWILIALSSNEPSVFQGLTKQGSLFAGIVPLALLLIINTSLLIGWSYGRDGTRFMSQNNLPVAIDKLESSTIFDPVNPTYLTNLSQLYLAKGINDNDREYKDKAIATIDKAIKNNPTNFEWHIIKTRFLVELGQHEEAYHTALEAIECAPLEEVAYYDTARFFYDVDNNKMASYAENIIKLAHEEKTRLITGPYGNFSRNNKFYDDSRLAFLEGQISFNKKDYEFAKIKFSQANSDKALTQEAQQYLQETYEITDNYISNGGFETGDITSWNLYGNGGNIQDLVWKDERLWMNISKDNIETRDWSFNQAIHSFEPGQKFNISFDAFSRYDNGEVRLVIHQVGEDGHSPHKSTNISINQEVQNYKWIFETDNLKNKQSMRLYFIVPNKALEQDIYITNIKMTKIE